MREPHLLLALEPLGEPALLVLRGEPLGVGSGPSSSHRQDEGARQQRRDRLDDEQPLPVRQARIVEFAGFRQLTHGVIKGADIDVGIALDQGILETAFDFIGVEVGPVQGAKDKKFRFHTLIIILQLN